MPRPRKDGTKARAARHHKLSDIYVRKVKPETMAFAIWDTHQHGLALRVQPTGQKSFKVVYSRHSRANWLHLGDARAIGLADARQLAAKVMLEVATGRDPLAERRAERGTGTFEELATNYVEQYAKKHNKSWRQADALVRRYAIPKWGKLATKAITRSDVRNLVERIEAPVLANAVLASLSAVFSWAIRQEMVTVNPCKLVDRNPMTSRDRILSDTELPKFWAAFDAADTVVSAALKVLMLTGQRPGEVCSMRREHIVDGWWELPGQPVAELSWIGTKNGDSHRVWLPASVRSIIGSTATGFAFPGKRGQGVAGLDTAMRKICAALNVDRATPHDLRRTFSSKVTGLGFGRETMHRLTNHREGGVGDVYDRHQYGPENQRAMEAVSNHILAIAEGRKLADNVVALNG
jgi:integrase